MSPGPRARFGIVGMARSGTTATHRAVYGHPAVRDARRGDCRPALHTGDLDVHRQRHEPPRHAREVRGAVRASHAARSRGDALVTCLVENFPDVRVAQVRRADLLAQFASLERANRTGVWHKHAEGSCPDRSQRAGPSPTEPERWPLDVAKFER